MACPDPEPRSPDIVSLDGYRWSTKENIGQGSYGRVLKGWTKDNDGAHDLAVKIISKHDFQDGDQTKEWVLREIKTLKSLKKHNCPNIVCLLGENLDINGDIVLFMELCDGDLHTLIKSRREGFTKHEAKHFIAQMAEGMRVLKAEGIVHRDLKPSNILYRTDAQAQRYVYQIADFGFAKFSEEEFRGDTRDGEMNSIPVGTICFMAPEAMNIHEQRSQGNKKVDLWSFGALLYYCLTKEVGFKVPALIEKDFNRLMQYLKDKDDALGMKIDVKINASSDSEDMLDINVDYDRFRQLPLSVQDRLSKEFAAKLTWFMKKLLVFEPETRMSFEDFFQYAEDFSSNHYMLCDGLSGEAEPFVPAKYSRIENLVSYISKKMTYTAGKFVIFCDQTQWLYAPWSEDEDSAVPQVSLLQDDSILCVISEEKNAKKTNPSIQYLIEAYALLSKSFVVVDKHDKIEKARRVLLGPSECLSTLQERQLRCLRSFWGFVSAKYFNHTCEFMCEAKRIIEELFGKTTENTRRTQECIRLLPEDSSFVEYVNSDLARFQHSLKELKQQIKAFNFNVEELVRLSTHPVLLEHSRFELELLDLCNEMIGAAAKGRSEIVSLKTKLQHHIVAVYEYVHTGFFTAFELLKLTVHVEATIEPLKHFAAELCQDTGAVLQNTFEEVFSLIRYEGDGDSIIERSHGDYSMEDIKPCPKSLHTVFRIVQQLRDAETSCGINGNHSWDLVKYVVDDIETQLRHLLPMTAVVDKPCMRLDSHSCAKLAVKLFPNYIPGDVAMFMQMDQDVFTAVHFTETRVFLSVTSVERYRTRFQTIPGSSVVLARVEDCPELITQPSQCIAAEYSVNCSPITAAF